MRSNSNEFVFFEDFYAFKTLLASQYDKIPTTVLTTSIQNIIASLFVYIAITIESVLQLFRYMLLSALYIIGPLALTMSQWKPTSSITRGWFLTLFQLSFWIITLRVLEATMLSLNVTSIISNRRHGRICSDVRTCDYARSDDAVNYCIINYRVTHKYGWRYSYGKSCSSINKVGWSCCKYF